MQAFNRKKTRAHIINLIVQLKKLESDQQKELKVGRWKEIIKVGAEMNELILNTKNNNETKS